MTLAFKARPAEFRERPTRAEASRQRRQMRAATTGRTTKSPASTARAHLGGGRRPEGRRPAPRHRSRYERTLPWANAQVTLPSLPAIRLEWRVASLAIVLLFGSLLFYMMSQPAYFVDAINLAGAVHVPAEEIYKASGLNRTHIFWLEPAAIQANVEKVPGIASAAVELRWPNVVSISVVERGPVLSWEQGGEKVWVDRSGALFAARGEITGLLPVVVDDAQKPVEEGQTVPAEAIAGALQLRALRPNIEMLHYDALNGLSYQDGRGWRGYFGVGANMEVKLAVYETLVADLVRRDIHPAVVSVSNPDAPYYRKQ